MLSTKIHGMATESTTRPKPSTLTKPVTMATTKSASATNAAFGLPGATKASAAVARQQSTVSKPSSSLRRAVRSANPPRIGESRATHTAVAVTPRDGLEEVRIRVTWQEVDGTDAKVELTTVKR